MALSDIVKKVKKTVERELARGDESVLGIDISSSTLKVVQAKRKRGQAVLETYGELSLGSYIGVEEGTAVSLNADQLSQALKDLMAEAKVTTKNCGVAIPLSTSLINVVEMPDVGEKRLGEMVPLEIRKYIPVSIDEVALDWRVIPRKGMPGEEENQKQGDTERVSDKVDVLTVAIHKDTLNKYQNILTQAGLEPSFFEIEVFSSVRSVLDGESGATMIIDIGASTTKMFIVEHRVLRESHIINRGSREITHALASSLAISPVRAQELKHTHGVTENKDQPEIKEVTTRILDQIFSEAHRLKLNYEKRFKKSVELVVLSGGGAGLPGLTGEAQKALETEVAIADPFRKLAAPAFLENVLRASGPSFALAVGVALRKLEEQA